jgi:hypothetical protein
MPFSCFPLLPTHAAIFIWIAGPPRGEDYRSVEDLMQYGLLVSAWVMAFMLGKELQTGFAQWRERRRRID